MAELTDEQLQRDADYVKGRTGLGGKVADLFDPGARKRADSAQQELKRREMQRQQEAAAEAERQKAQRQTQQITFKKGGAVKSRGDGKAQRGKTRGRFV